MRITSLRALLALSIILFIANLVLVSFLLKNSGEVNSKHKSLNNIKNDKQFALTIKV